MLRFPALFKLQDVPLANFGVVKTWLEHEVVAGLQRRARMSAVLGIAGSRPPLYGCSMPVPASKPLCRSHILEQPWYSAFRDRLHPWEASATAPALTPMLCCWDV
jgi:hypothetical protein